MRISDWSSDVCSSDLWEIVAGVEDPRDAFAEDLGIIFVGKVAKAFYFGFFVAAVGRIVDHDRKLIRHRFIVRGEREAAIDLDRRDAKAAEVEAFREKKYFGRGEIADKGEVFGHIRSLLRSSLLARGIREFEECYCDLFGGIGAFPEILAEPALCPNRVVIGPLVDSLSVVYGKSGSFR